MMPVTVGTFRLATVLLSVSLAAFSASCPAADPAAVDGSSFALIVLHPAGSGSDKFVREQSDCRRYGVIWSGGTALRRSDRISPRPVRSRWQAAGASRIRCADGGAFEQTLVADQPWIR